MTEPNPSAKPATLPGVTVVGGVQPGPDGKTWGVLTIQHGLLGMQLIINEATLDQLQTIIPQVMGQVMDEVRRARIGLIVPRPNGTRGVSFPPERPV